MPLLRTLLATLAVTAGVATPAHAVVGGQDASPGEYPYVAHILIDRAFQCTGTLVTPTHVVTAAHCVVDETAGSVRGSQDGRAASKRSMSSRFRSVRTTSSSPSSSRHRV